jgi:hypothetical protein
LSRTATARSCRRRPASWIKLPSPKVLDVSMASGTPVTIAVSDIVAVELRED